jgi:predicted DNA-binding helix-hairpin-helix protein
VATIVVLLGMLIPTQGSAQLVQSSSFLIDPNRADEQQLMSVSGVNAPLAESIIEGRPWLLMTRLDQLFVRAGLTRPERETIYRSLWEPLDLNTAGAAEFFLIPGFTDEVFHEVERYRPYESLEEFLEEMDQSVESALLAVLTAYAFVPVNPNNATPEQLLAIPGVEEDLVQRVVGRRPFASIDEFYATLGRIRGEAEVARLTQFFHLPN